MQRRPLLPLPTTLCGASTGPKGPGPLVQALTILAEQTDNKALAEVTKKVVFDVESGNTVADALSKHPRAFTNLYVNMVAAGEAGGILDTILLRLATFLEKNDA